MKHNKKSVYLLILGFLLFYSWIPQQIADTHIPQQIVEKGRNSTVLLVRLGANDLGSGSGFFVEPDKIVTNIHVVATGTIVLAVGTETVYTIEGVIASDPKQDLVILKVLGQGEPLPLASGQIGDPVFVVGYPAGGYKIGENAIHGIRNSDKQIRFIQNYKGTMIAPGNSGGPVLNLGGKVIGIATLADESGDYAYASPSNALKLLLARVGPVEPLSQWQRRPTIQAYAYKRSAVAKLRSHASEEAIKVLDKAIELYPNFREAYYNRGFAKAALARVEAVRGDLEAAESHYDRAIADYTRAIDLNADYAEAYYNRGNANRELSDYEMAQGDEGDLEAAESHYNRAIADYTRAIDLNADYAEAYYNRGLVRAALGQDEAVRGDLEAAESHYNRAIADYTKVLELEPRDADAYFIRGFAKKANRDYEAAIADYTRATELNTDHAEAYYNRGLARAALGQDEAVRGDLEAAESHYNRAIVDYTRAIELNTDHAEAYYNRGLARAALGQDEAAEQDKVTSYYYSGIIDSNRGHYQAAIDKVDKILELKPDYAEAYLLRADVRRMFGQSKRDSGDMGKARGLYQRAIADYTQAICMNKDYIVAYYNRGLARTTLGRIEAVRGDLEAAESHYNRAIADFSNYIKSNPEDATAYFNLGAVQFFLSNYLQAIADCTQAIHLKRDYADAYYNRGGAKAALGQDEGAKLDDATYYYYSGITDNNRRHYQAAIDKVNKALELKPDYAEAYLLRADVKGMFGQSKANSGDMGEARDLYQGAIDDYTQAVSINKDYVVAYYYRGVIKLLRGDDGDYQTAIADFNTVLKLSSGLGIIYRELGLAKCLLGYRGPVEKSLSRYNEAIAAFNEAIKLEPDNAEYYQFLGVAKAVLGQNKEAIAAFETVKKRGSDVGK